MPRATGVQVEAGHIRICEVDGTSRKFRVVRYVEAECPEVAGAEELQQATAEAVRAAFQKNRIRRDPVAASVSASRSILRSISVPFLGDDQIRKVYRFEAESHLHACSLEEVVLDYFKTGESRDRSDLLVFAVRKALLRKQLDLLEESGIDPMLVDLDVLALFNMLTATGMLEDDRATLLLDVGRNVTNILLADGKTLALVRSIRVGVLPKPATPAPEAPGAEGAPEPEGGGSEEDEPLEVDVTLENDYLIVDEEDFEDSGADAAEAAAEGTATEPAGGTGLTGMDRILTELQRCLVSARFERPIGRILLAGEGSLLEGFPEVLEREFEVPVEDLDFTGRVAADLGESEMESFSTNGGIALGLAVKLLGVDPIGVNFRQDEFRFQRAFEQVKIVLSCCVSLVAILFLIVLAFLLERKREASLPWNLIVSRARTVYEQVMPDQRVEGSDFTVIAEMAGNVQRSNRDYRKRFGGAGSGEFPPLRSALEIWKDVFRGIQMANVRAFKLDSMAVTQTNVRFAGSVPESSATYAIEESLKKASDLFKDAKAGRINTEKDGTFSFPNFVIELPEE